MLLIPILKQATCILSQTGQEHIRIFNTVCSLIIEAPDEVSNKDFYVPENYQIRVFNATRKISKVRKNFFDNSTISR